MEIIQLPQGGGKTTQLVKFMLRPGNEDVVYIAPTHAQATMAYKMALDEKLSVDQGRFLAATRGNLSEHLNPGARVVIDELEAVVSQALGLGNNFIEWAALTPTSAKREYKRLADDLVKAELELNQAKWRMENYKASVHSFLPQVTEIEGQE